MRTGTFVFSIAAALAFAAPPSLLAQGQTQTVSEIYRPGPGIVNPVLLTQEQPKYTSDAVRAGIQGTVELEAVVLPDGTVGDVRVVRSLDERFGLDAIAISAARNWRFRPGTRDGRPVAVIVTLILEYKLGGPTWKPGMPLGSPLATIQTTDDEFTKGAYRQGTAGVVAPVITHQVQPRYLSGAMRAKIQGTVEVEAVVMPDGTVGRARVVRSLDKEYGLDGQALFAVARWTFKPGTFNGQPVPVIVTLTMEFRLH